MVARALVIFPLLAMTWCQTAPDKRRLDAELALGRALTTAIERSAPRLLDVTTEAYLAGIAQRLRPSQLRLPIEVRVVQYDEPRAGILPGGIIYLSSGLILRSSSEAELAGVIAHEIGHVPGGFSIGPRQYEGQQSVPPFLVSGPWGPCSRFDKGLFVALGFKERANEMELAADRLGLEYALTAGYDPEGFRDFLTRVRPDGMIPVASSKRPGPGQSYVVTTSSFESIRARMPQKRIVRHESPTLLKTADPDEERPVLKRP